MKNPVTREHGAPQPDLAQSVLVRSLTLERFGLGWAQPALDSDGLRSAPEPAASPVARRPRRRYRGRTLASGCRR